MAGLTFDTGALIALERRRQRMRKVVDVATGEGVQITVPAVVLAEWWRGPGELTTLIRAMFTVESTDESLAAVAGEAQARVTGATAVDAIVMASAARRGDVVYTSDFADLSNLARVFPNVRVLGV